MSKPFFHADHVGSLLGLREFLEARTRWKAGEIDHDSLRHLEDAAIRDAAKMQEDLGLEAIADAPSRASHSRR